MTWVLLKSSISSFEVVMFIRKSTMFSANKAPPIKPESFTLSYSFVCLDDTSEVNIISYYRNHITSYSQIIRSPKSLQIQSNSALCPTLFMVKCHTIFGICVYLFIWLLSHRQVLWVTCNKNKKNNV